MGDTALAVLSATSLLMAIKLRLIVILSVIASTVAAILDLQVARIVAFDELFGLAFTVPTPAALSQAM